MKARPDPKRHQEAACSLLQLTRQTLLAAGARLVYREIEDLSHTYPRDENPKILDWLVGAPTA